jgi:hypothetical protein
VTAYFDKAQAELGRIRNDKSYLEWLRTAPNARVFVIEDAVRDWEIQLVADCTIAVYFPGYAGLDPLDEKYKAALNQTVLDHGVYTLPLAADPDINTPDKFWSRLGDLCWHLHTLFHTIAQETGRSDSPKAPLVRLANEGYDDRDLMYGKTQP